MRIILRELELMLSYDVGIFIEYYEPDRTTSAGLVAWGYHMIGYPYVVPQSRDPTNSACLRLAIGEVEMGKGGE